MVDVGSAICYLLVELRNVSYHSAVSGEIKTGENICHICLLVVLSLGVARGDSDVGIIRGGFTPRRVASVFISRHASLDRKNGALRREIFVVIVAAQRRT